MKYIKRTMLLVIILIILKISSVYAIDGVVLQDGIRIRKGPSTDTAIVTVLNKEAPVEIIEETNGWYKIKYTQLGNYEGYMRKDFIKQTGTGTIPVTNSAQTTPAPTQTSTPTPTVTPTPVDTSTPAVTETPAVNLLGEKIVNNDANVYILPVVTSSIKDTIKKNGEISVREVAGNFAYIEYNGKTGWVRTSLIEEKPAKDTTKKTTNRGSSSRETAVSVTENKTATTTPTQVVNTPVVKTETAAVPVKTSSIGEQIASMAKTYVGYKYVYGGASPSTGFDCSGLVYYICGNLGCKVNRTADAQANNGVYVEKANLQPGDLIFFTDYKTNKGIGHVGIYIGNNQFVHASTPTVGVIVSNLSDATYVKRYVTARRVDI